MLTRPLHAVLVDGTEAAGRRLLELLAAALDGSGPAIAPVDAGLPAPAREKLLDALAPEAVQDTRGATTARSAGKKKAVAGGTAVVIGTSGSTGAPKGVELSAAALTWSARASLVRIGAGPGPTGRWLCCLPLTHIAGLQVLVRSLVGGTEPVLADRADAGSVAAASAAGCAHVSLVPTQLRRLLGSRGDPGGSAPRGSTDAGPLAGFSSVLLGGAAAPPGLLQAARAAGVPVVTTYGMTETCGGCVYDGLPLDGVRVAIRDEAGAAARDGRIWIGGPVLFTGYLGGTRGAEGVWGERLPPKSGSAGYGGAGSPPMSGEGRGGRGAGAPSARGQRGVVPPEETQRWFRTGDLGGLDPRGRLCVRGRADDVITTGGHKVVPGEVAEALQNCRGVADVAVVGEPDPDWGERVVAVVVPADPAHPPTLKLLRLHVQERLPRYAAPSRVVVVDAVPVLPSGKHDIARIRREMLRWEQTEAESVS